MTNTKLHITEAEAERKADKMVMSRLNTDRGYIHAEDAEAQAAAEERIERAVWAELERKYTIEA